MAWPQNYFQGSVCPLELNPHVWWTLKLKCVADSQKGQGVKILFGKKTHVGKRVLRTRIPCPSLVYDLLAIVT